MFWPILWYLVDVLIFIFRNFFPRVLLGLFSPSSSLLLMSEDNKLLDVWNLGSGRGEKGGKIIKNRLSLFLFFIFHFTSLASSISEIFVTRKSQILTCSIWYPKIGWLPSICYKIWNNIVRKRHNQPKGMSTTTVHWLLLSCSIFKWSKELHCFVNER